MRNVGTWRPDAKEDLQAADPQGAEYRCGAQGRMGPYEQRSLVMRAEQRDPTLQPKMVANQRGEEPLSEVKPFKRFRRRERASMYWLGRIARRDPNLFVLWQLGVRPEAGG